METEPSLVPPPAGAAISSDGKTMVDLPLPSMRAAVLVLGYLFLVFAGYLHTWADAPYPSEDTPGYASLAADLKHFTLTQMHGRTPGFPLFLLMTGAGQSPSRLFYCASLALHFASVVLLTYVLFVLGVGWVSIVVFMLIACMPPFVEWAAQMSTETLSEFLTVTMFVLLVGWLATKRASLLAAYSLTALLAALTRPTFQAVTVILAVCLFGCRAFGLFQISLRKLALSMATAILVSVAALGGYSTINYIKFGYFGTSIFPAYAASHKVVGVLEFLPDRYADLREILIRHRNALMADPKSDHTGQNYIYRALPELTAYFHGDRVNALKTMQELSVSLIKAKPVSYLNECTKAMAVYWMPTNGPLSSTSPGRRALWAAFELGILGVFLLQALAMTGHALYILPRSFLHTSRRQRLDVLDNWRICTYLIGSTVIWYTMLISCFAGIGLARYRVPTDLIILSVTLIGYQIWRNRTASL